MVGVALGAAVACWSVPVAGSDVALTAGKVAKIKDTSGTASDQAIVKFVKEPGLSGAIAAPLCPAVSSIRLTTDTHDLLAVLDCHRWSPVASGYLYDDPAGVHGGVQKVKLVYKSTGGKLQMTLRGDQYGANAIGGPVAFLDAALTVGTTNYCGRFVAPTSTFKKNDADKILIKGPSTGCVLPPTATATLTATATRTHTATPTITVTRTVTLTATPTATPTVTDTVTAGPSPTPTATTVPAVVFRIDSLALRDPHAFVDLFGSCLDATDPPGLFGFSVNGQVASQIGSDGDMDGFLDLNLLALFRPLSQPPVAGANAEIATGLCTPPSGSEVCGPDLNPSQSTPYTNQSAGVCLTPLAGTTGPDNTGSYSPSTITPGAPCFSTLPVTLTLPFGLFTIPLQDVRVAAQYVGAPASQLIDGLIYGFLSESDADGIVLPATLPLIGGQPISMLLPGGSGACPTHTAKDVGPLAQPGWYFYLNFTAHPVTWTGS
jgi:hypothetical protein